LTGASKRFDLGYLEVARAIPASDLSAVRLKISRYEDSLALEDQAGAGFLR
jgi:hypothetical protein